jgi:hypothetical protein
LPHCRPSSAMTRSWMLPCLDADWLADVVEVATADYGLPCLPQCRTLPL